MVFSTRICLGILIYYTLYYYLFKYIVIMSKQWERFLFFTVFDLQLLIRLPFLLSFLNELLLSISSTIWWHWHNYCVSLQILMNVKWILVTATEFVQIRQVLLLANVRLVILVMVLSVSVSINLIYPIIWQKFSWIILLLNVSKHLRTQYILACNLMYHVVSLTNTSFRACVP